ncbi:TetR family transcriptional regulator [Microbacteriaceae bacterium MWH-Ta3]|nr:TetR family transcriptional regulator [Microbacteriaceae bacterium MWH-Ta3]
MSTTSPRRSPGRPVSIDPGEVALTAMHLFHERGIDNVTMDDIAVAAGVSRRTVFRLYPSKAALVWGGMKPWTNRLRTELQREDLPSDPAEALVSAWVNSLEGLDISMDVTKLRLKLVAQSHEAYAWGLAEMEETLSILAENIEKRTGIARDSLEVTTLVSAMYAAGHNASEWWATHDDPRSLKEILRTAFSALDDPKFHSR